MSRASLGVILALSVLTMNPVFGVTWAKEKDSPQPIRVTKHVDPASSPLRGGNGNDRKGGRYLGVTETSMKKLPGKKKPPTLTLKRGTNQD